MMSKLLKIFFVVILIIGTTTSLGINVNQEKNSWNKVNENGFGDKNNVAPRGVTVFNDTLLVGTGNCNFSEGYWGDLFEGGSIREFINDFKSKKETFVSTGCEIWGYKDKNWTCFVGENGNTNGGFGDNNSNQVGFLIEYKDFLYAGLCNQVEGCEIWRTNNLENWEKVVDSGFGNIENFWAMTAIIFRNELYVGTGNWNKSEIYRTSDGKNWTQVVGEDSKTPAGFGMEDNFYIWSMCVYNSNLYVGTANSKGCEIWKTLDGLNWDPIVAYNSFFESRNNGAQHQRGFGKYWVGCARNMMVFNNELYIFSAIRGYVNIVVKFFERKIVDFNFAFPDLKYPAFNLVPRSGQIWKYNDTTETWSRIVGGWGKSSNSAGFGDRLNQYLWAVSSYNGKMYVGTMHLDPTVIRLEINGLFNHTISTDIPTGKAEIWSTSNGDNWKQVNTDGFGDKYNLAIREMETFDGALYAFTVNLDDGCEVWSLEEI